MLDIFITQKYNKRFEDYKKSCKRISSYNHNDEEVLLDFGNGLEAIPKGESKLDFGNGLEEFIPYNLDITLSEYRRKCEVLDFSDDKIDFNKVDVIVDLDLDFDDCPEWDDEEDDEIEIEKEVIDKPEIETASIDCKLNTIEAIEEPTRSEQKDLFDNEIDNIFNFTENNSDTNTLTFFANSYFLANNAVFMMPENGVLNKGMTGCGGTTQALADDNNYFISMPYTKLVISKHEQYKEDSFALFEKSQKGRGSETLEEYLKRRDIEGKPYKILGTYNSIRNIVNLGSEKLKEINLLVDEYQILLDDYSFRFLVIDDLIKFHKLFKSYTFMSATPILERYLFPELKDIPVTNVEWIGATKPKVKIVDYTIERRTLEAVSAFIRRKVNEGLHVYCYINAVESIQKIISANEWMNVNNSKVIYSQYSKAEITDSQGNVFSKKANVNSENKDITFITATGFVGLDIKDEKGVSIVVSMKAKREYTYHNPSTIIRQIMGRNRLKKDHVIYHFVDLVDSELQSSEEKDEFTFNEIEGINKTIEYINSCQSIAEREFKIKEMPLNNDNVIYDTNTYYCIFKGKNKMIYDAYKYYIQSLYWNIESLKNAYLESGFEVEQLNTEDLEMFASPVRRRRPNRSNEMMNLFEQYADNYDCPEWQEWFNDNEGNGVYKDLLTKGLRTPEQLFHHPKSIKYWEQYLSDFEHANSFSYKVMSRLKKIGYLKPGNEFSFTGLNLACYKVEQEVLKIENNTETPELSNIKSKEKYDENKKIKSGIYKKYFVTKEVMIKEKDSDKRYKGLKIIGYKTIQDFKVVMKKPEKVKKTKIIN